ASVGRDSPDVRTACTRRGEVDPAAVTGPRSGAIDGGLKREALGPPTVGVHNEDVGVSVDGRGIHDLPAVRRPPICLELGGSDGSKLPPAGTIDFRDPQLRGGRPKRM